MRRGTGQERYNDNDARGAVRRRWRRAGGGAGHHRLRHALTGSTAANGRAALIAMTLWEQDINAAGGLLGRPVKLV
jgi:hypothetical protein